MNGRLNGAADRFDKLLRRADMLKADDAMRVLRKLAPATARTLDEIDGKFAEILARLQKIEDAHEEQARQPSRILAGPREPDGEAVLAQMRTMTPEMRAALLSKLRQ
jgi:hypothetical protein